jgi:heme-degrading monooxygenase HmoA
MLLPSPPSGAIAVIFVSQRRDADEAGYAAAAQAMEELATKQPGFAGFVAARGADGVGIAVSYWKDEASAIGWRQQADHASVRAQGRSEWYDSYVVSVAEVSRSYSWERQAS